MSQIQEVKEANNIVEVISERIKLDHSGANYRACCPFHNEKTPSFFVSETMQRYRCFGCGASGDVLDFLQNFDGLTFYESLKSLADRANIQLRDYQRTSEDEERDRIYEALDLAKEYYHYLLTKHEVAKVAREYLQNRGCQNDSIKLFQLGFSTEAWDGLIRYLHDKKKFSLEILEKAGLVIRAKNGRYYDRFRGRLMFPLKNHRGQVVGFSGRVLSAEVKEAKYINSPETLLYHKSKMLYGYSELLREIKKKEKVIVVEGEFDMISSTQAHVNNVVAIKGSALTADQVQLLSRVAKTIILSLDADSAGVKATMRAIEIVNQFGLELRVLDLKHLDFLAAEDKVKDPDELARHTPKLWRQATESTISAYQFLLNCSFDAHDPKTPEGKREIINELAPMLNQITHAVEREYYLQQLAKKLQVKESLLAEDIRRFGKAKHVLQKTPEKTKVGKSFREKNEEYAIFLLFQLPPTEIVAEAKKIAELDFATPGIKSLLQQLSLWQGTLKVENFANRLAEDLKAQLMTYLLQPEYEKMLDQLELESEWEKIQKLLQKEALRAEIQAIDAKISSLDALTQRDENQEKELDQLLNLIIEKQQGIQKIG